MAGTKDQQVKRVVVGLAVGVLAQGVEAVTSSKGTLESAFNHAWWKWSCADQFPAIRGHNPGNQFWVGMGKAGRRQLVVAAWDEDQWSTPYLTNPRWTVKDALDHISDSDVSAEEWRELGRLFVEHFKPSDIRCRVA